VAFVVAAGESAAERIVHAPTPTAAIVRAASAANTHLRCPARARGRGLFLVLLGMMLTR
jgi:hypothetical protein